MKSTIKYIFVLLGLVTMLQACFKDKGNYTYVAEPTALTISDEMRRSPENPNFPYFVFKVGTPIEIPAKYTINDASLTEDMLSFEWFLGDKVVSTDNVLRLEPQPASYYNGMLVIEDTRYGIKYESALSFQVQDTFAEGMAFLTEKDGRSHISYMEVPQGTSDYVFMPDVYVDEVELSAGVTGFSYHMYETYPQIFGLFVCQPGSEGPIELDAHNMGIVGKFYNGFAGAVPDAAIEEVAYTSDGIYNYLYLRTADGDLYARTDEKFNNYTVPFSGLFPAMPLPGVKITNWTNVSKISSMASGWANMIGYDAQNESCVLIKGLKVTPLSDIFYSNATEPHRGGAGYDGTNTYDDITYPEPYALSAYNVIDVIGVGYDTDMLASPALSVVMLLERKSDSKLFFYTWRYWDSWGSIDVDLDLFFPVPSELAIDKTDFVTCVTNLGGPTSILYFAANDNKDLYYLDAIYGTCKKVYSSGSAITGLGMGEVQNPMAALSMDVYGPLYETIFVGTEDGKINILKIDAAARAAGNAPVLHTHDLGLGAVKHITYLSNFVLKY